MKKIILLIALAFAMSFWLSSAYYHNWIKYNRNWNYYWNYYYSPYQYIWVDRCCIIETIDYKDKLDFINRTIHKKYPNIARKVWRLVSDLVSTVNWNRKYRYRKAKIYKAITEKVIDYAYDKNIKRWTPTYLTLSYFTYRIYDMYKYEKSKEKYNLENLIDNLDTNPYDY